MHCVMKYLQLRTYCTCLLTLYTQRHTHIRHVHALANKHTHTYVCTGAQTGREAHYLNVPTQHTHTYIRTYIQYVYSTYVRINLLTVHNSPSIPTTRKYLSGVRSAMIPLQVNKREQKNVHK